MRKIYGIGTFSHSKFSLQILNGNVFTYEMEPSQMKINFTCEIFISHKELKQFTNDILFPNVKIKGKFL